MSRKTQATAILILMLIGFIATYHIELTWVKILNAGFLAAVIGGLADWFAVTALFRKPLGFISYRTEILPRNRERIIEEIVQFIGKDLLNPEYIIGYLRNYSPTGLFFKYLQAMQGQEKVEAAIKEIADFSFANIDAREITLDTLAYLEKESKNEVFQYKFNHEVQKILRNYGENPLVDEFIKVSTDFIDVLLQEEFIEQLIDYHVENIKEMYIRDNALRKFAAGFIDLSGKNLARKARVYLAERRAEFLVPDSYERRYFMIKLRRNLQRYLSKERNWQDLVSEFYGVVKNDTELPTELISIVEKKGKSIERRNQMVTQIVAYERYYLENLYKNEVKWQEIDNWIYEKVSAFILSHGEWQLNYFREQLNAYSNEKLVALVENKVGDDLQMIRINGSIVGAMVGMVLYIVSLVVERVCS